MSTDCRCHREKMTAGITRTSGHAYNVLFIIELRSKVSSCFCENGKLMLMQCTHVFIAGMSLCLLNIIPSQSMLLCVYQQFQRMFLPERGLSIKQYQGAHLFV